MTLSAVALCGNARRWQLERNNVESCNWLLVSVGNGLCRRLGHSTDGSSRMVLLECLALVLMQLVGHGEGQHVADGNLYRG